jgi:hypothetical protein
MRRSLKSTAVAYALAAVLLNAVPAWAAAPPNPVSDCNRHGMLTHHYTPAQLRKALSTMPADIREYTNCYDVINRALLQALGKRLPGASTSNSSSGSSFLPTPVIVVLVILLLAAVTFGAVALRRRRGADDGDGPGGPAGPEAR